MRAYRSPGRTPGWGAWKAAPGRNWLRVVEDVDPDTVLELVIAAPAGTNGEVVVDFGLVLV